eukprot:508743-Amphidinium_carterae.1
MKEFGYTHKNIVPQGCQDLDPATAVDVTENLVMKVVYMTHTLSIEPSRVFNLDETSCKFFPLSEQTWTKGHLVGLSKPVISKLTATVTPIVTLDKSVP